MIRINLTKSQKDNLRDMKYQNSTECLEHSWMVLLSNDGKSPKEISLILKRHEHTVRFWLKRYLEQDIDGLKKIKPMGKPLKHHQLDNILKECYAYGPKHFGYSAEQWTVSLLCDYYSKTTGNSISKDTIRRALKKTRYRYKKAKKTVPANAPIKE